jgi:hypothetical protein
MLKARFSQNWATAELVKQYMRNHCCYEAKKGQMMPRHQHSAANSSRNTSQVPNIDSNDNEDIENDGDENEGGKHNESDEEDDKRLQQPSPSIRAKMASVDLKF